MKSNFEAASQFVSFGMKEKEQGSRESASGPGSFLRNTSEVRIMLSSLVKEWGVRSILDLGCGDWNWMSTIMPELSESYSVQYSGWDACSNLIEMLNENYGSDLINFEHKDIVDDDYPSVDLIICRDVLFHMKPDIINRVLDKVSKGSTRLFMTSNHEVDRNQEYGDIKNNNNIDGWYYHLLNIDIFPYNFGFHKIMETREFNNSHNNVNRNCVVYNLRGDNMMNNLFLSVGAMKAGTTWLYEQLKNHPDIHFTPEKEIHYFANKVGIENQLNHRNRIIKLKETMQDTANGNPKYISENLEKICWYSEYARNNEIDNDWYLSLFRFNDCKRYNADFSNLYCQMDSSGWDNVRKVSSNIKVIYTLRDPIERLWSHYKFHMKWVNREDEALDAGFEHFKHLLDQHFFWVNAEYAKNYELLKQSLTSEELMVLYFEDFREKPVEMLIEVQRFLGIQEIAPDSQNLNKKVNKTKSFSMPSEWREYAMERLSTPMQEMKNAGIFHRNWTDC